MEGRCIGLSDVGHQYRNEKIKDKMSSESSLVLSLVEKQALGQVWRQCYLWSFPYYLAGAAIASAIVFSGRTVGWKPALLMLPVMYMIFSYYRLHLLQQSEEDYRTATSPARG